MSKNVKTDLQHLVVVVAGPTASGKSKFAIDAALAYDGIVVNADSQQVYKTIPIISACPSTEDKQLVPHRLYEILDPGEQGSVVDWLAWAVEEIRSAWRQGKVPIVVGGTGLYLDNLINGTTPIPETPQDIRQQVATMIAQDGVQKLHEKLGQVDEEAAQRLSPNDTTRVRRAYEVWLATGQTLSAWHRLPMIKTLPEANFKVVKILPSLDDLDERCALRFDMMMREGALDEVQTLQKLHLSETLPAMRAIGVPEIMSYLKGDTSLEEAVALAKLHSRQYAKRQRTWFRNKLKADVEIDACYKGDFDFSTLKW